MSRAVIIGGGMSLLQYVEYMHAAFRTYDHTQTYTDVHIDTYVPEHGA